MQRDGVRTIYFPYYGHFYGCMGMLLVQQEFQSGEQYRTETNAYMDGTLKMLADWQQKDGSWPNKGWYAGSHGQGTSAYASAFATLAMFVPEKRLSIYHRNPPKLSEAVKE